MLTKQETERARALILRGRASLEEGESEKQAKARERKHREERELIERFFRELTPADLNHCIAQFETSEEIEHRKECAQLVIAYYIWSKNCNCGAVSVEGCGARERDGWRDVDTYLREFVRVAFERMTGLPNDPGEGFDLPKWQSPNAGFGWVYENHRPPRNDLNRDIGIIAFIELRRREGKTPLAAARQARKEFSYNPHKPLSLEKVKTIIRGLGDFLLDLGSLDDWVPLTYSDEELRESENTARDLVAKRRRRVRA